MSESMKTEEVGRECEAKVSLNDDAWRRAVRRPSRSFWGDETFQLTR